MPNPMLHELFALLPGRITAAPTGVLAGTAAGGLLLGWFGARFSRAQWTLAGAAAGALTGMRLPGLLHWSIDPVSLGVAGAVVLGTAGYLFHRTLVALALGAVLALWALAGVWIAAGNGAKWNPTGLRWSGDTVLYLQQLWHTLPGDLSRLVPAFCTGALTAGLLTGILWPRLSRCLLYSVAGFTLLLPAGLVLTARLRPDGLALLPESPAVQVPILVAWTAMTLVVQWRLSRPVSKRAQPAKAAPREQRLVAKQVLPRPVVQSGGRRIPVIQNGPIRPILFTAPATPAVGRA
jgi:hypothetical protein